jgi:hypothetical protein
MKKGDNKWRRNEMKGKIENVRNKFKETRKAEEENITDDKKEM